LSRRPRIERAADDGDLALVERAQQGDREALGELFVCHSIGVRRLLTSVVGPVAEIDDLVQEVFIQVQRSLPRFRRASRFSTWLHQIAVNTAITHLRRLKGKPVAAEPSAMERRAVDDRADAHDALVGREMVRRLYGILDTVTPKRRAAFTLFEIEGRSIAEVADILGVPTAVAKSRIWFARREIKRKAAGDEYLGPLLEELRR
jgi:RNA polymerase sigma-70 factor (ECF subfamily)